MYMARLFVKQQCVWEQAVWSVMRALQPPVQCVSPFCVWLYFLARKSLLANSALPSALFITEIITEGCVPDGPPRLPAGRNADDTA